MKGRKAAPQRLKILSDERPDRRAKATQDASQAPAGPPAHLDATGRAKWAEMTEGLATGALTRYRAELIAIYCEAHSRKLEAFDLIWPSAAGDGQPHPGGIATRCGTGGLKPHPALRVIKDAESTMLRVLSDLARLDATAPAEAEEDTLGSLIAKARRKNA